MARSLQIAVKSSGYQSVLYRHVDGQIYDAYIKGQQVGAISTPGTPTVTPQGTTGATTYGYRIVARNSSGVTLPGTGGTTATGNATLSATNFNRVTWSAVTGAESYDVYGRTAAAELFMVNTTALQFDDTGTVTPSGALPGSNTTVTGYNVYVPNLKYAKAPSIDPAPGGITVTPAVTRVGGGRNKIAVQVATTRTQTGVIFNPGAKP